jgi:Thiamine-binding protein
MTFDHMMAARGASRSARYARAWDDCGIHQVTPLGTGEGVGEIVAEAVRVVRASGLPNQTDSMFTTIEGDWVGVQ